jgi:putative hydrolase of the HAD superfamily
VRGGAARRAVLLDVGDTLVRRPAVGPGRRLAAALGLPPEAARAIGRIVFGERHESPGALAERLGRELALGRGAEAAIAAVWRAQEREPVEVEGATALVAAARAAGAHVALVSNIWAPYEAGFRRACPAIVPLVDSWHLSYRAGRAKPDPELFRAALAAAGVPAARAVMVGDSLEKDVAPAAALGMAAIWVAGGGDERAGGEDATSVPPSVERRSPSSAAAGGPAWAPAWRVARDLHEARATLTEILRGEGAAPLDADPRPPGRS